MVMTSSVKTERPEWIDDESCDEERDGEDHKHSIAHLVVLAVLRHFRKLSTQTAMKFRSSLSIQQLMPSIHHSVAVAVTQIL